MNINLNNETLSITFPAQELKSTLKKLNLPDFSSSENQWEMIALDLYQHKNVLLRGSLWKNHFEIEIETIIEI